MGLNRRPTDLQNLPRALPAFALWRGTIALLAAQRACAGGRKHDIKKEDKASTGRSNGVLVSRWVLEIMNMGNGQNLRWGYCLVWAVLCMSPAVAEDNAASASGAPVAAVQWYACPAGEKQAVYTTQPLDVLCQKAKHPPVVTVGQTAAAGNEALQRLWYEAEFGSAGDVAILPKQIGMPAVHLRQPSGQAVMTKTTLRHMPVPPVRIVAPPKPLTPRQLIQRDISKEQRALTAAQAQLKAAQLSGNTQRIRQWRQSVADRQNNIRALKQELQHQ